jgi:hypothetical protein
VLRYILFYYVSLVNAAVRFNELRNQISLNMKIFSFGLIVWQPIREIITDVLEQYAASVDEMLLAIITVEIDDRVCRYFQNLFPIVVGIHPEDIQKLDAAEKKRRILGVKWASFAREVA